MTAGSRCWIGHGHLGKHILRYEQTSFSRFKYFLKHVFGCAVSVSLSLAASASADVSIQEVDVSLLPDLRQPGQAWERISGQTVHLFDGVDVPLIHVSGTRKSWFVESASLR